MPSCVSAPPEKFRPALTRRGFGSLRVPVTVGGSTWTTSIFPGTARGRYVLLIKRAIRKAEALNAGELNGPDRRARRPLTTSDKPASTLDSRQLRTCQKPAVM